VPEDHPPVPSGVNAVLDAQRSHEWGSALRNGLKMGGSLIITWSVAMIVNVRVPATLGPVRQGHFGFAESFAAMFFAVLGLGIDTHLIKEVAVRPKHASEVVGGVFVLRLLISVVLFAVMATVLWVTARPPEVFLAVMVFGVTNILMAINATLGAVLQAVSRVGAPSVANVVTKTLWGIGLLLGLHYNAPLAVLALPGLVGEGARIAILAPAARSGADLRYRIDISTVRAVLIESIPYFINSLALGVLGGVAVTVLEFVRADEREVGWFSAIKNLANLCMLLSPLIFWVVMPLLARARARSDEEAMAVFRRCLEGIVVAIIPVTVLISAGADFLIHIAFHDKYAPARTGLSILSLVFVMTYMNTMLAMKLIITGRGWSVTTISISSIFVTALLVLTFAPMGRRLLGEGGECAGTAAAVIGSEACVLVAMLTRFREFPLDARNIRVFSKAIALGVVVLIVDRRLRALGTGRLLIDAALYVAVALAIGVVRVQELGLVIRLLRHRGPGAPVAPVTEVPP
jgi:O-antigen/teichoic acid export membrane protein